MRVPGDAVLQAGAGRPRAPRVPQGHPPLPGSGARTPRVGEAGQHAAVTWGPRELNKVGLGEEWTGFNVGFSCWMDREGTVVRLGSMLR